MIEVKEWNGHLYLGNEFDANKKTLVFLHGFPDNFWVWESVCLLLADQFNIICPTAPGTVTDEENLSEKYRLENLSRRYREIIQFAVKGQTPLVLIAHDMGGPYAHQMLDFLSHDTKLICINTLSGQMMLGRKTNPEQLFRSFYMTLFQVPFVNKKTLERFWFPLRKKAQFFGKGDEKKVPSKYTGNILNGLSFYKALTKDVPFFLGKKSWKNPTLYLWGDDPFLVRPSERELGIFYDDCKLMEVKGGHWPMLEKPEVIADFVSRFSKDLI